MKEPTKEMLDQLALTCVHVLNKTAKYEYVEENKKTGATESFTCSKCLDLQEKNQKKVMKYLKLVHRECFVEARIS